MNSFTALPVLLTFSCIGAACVPEANGTCDTQGEIASLMQSRNIHRHLQWNRLQAEQQPCKGDLTTNEGKTTTQAPWKIGGVWVFGAFESGWFKMVSVNAKGEQLETRHSKTSLERSMSADKAKAVWDNANVGGDYSVKVTELCGCKGDITTNEGKTTTQAPWKIGGVRTVWVFGVYESGWFKMVGLNAKGEQLETRHSKTSLERSMTTDKAKAVWDNANVGGHYSVKANEFCSIDTEASTTTKVIVAAATTRTTTDGPATTKPDATATVTTMTTTKQVAAATGGCTEKMVYVGVGGCQPGNGTSDIHALSIGWSKCTCGTDKPGQVCSAGVCPNIEVCKAECLENPECGGFNWAERHCWLYKKTLSPSTMENDPAVWYTCYAKQERCPNAMCEKVGISTEIAATACESKMPDGYGSLNDFIDDCIYNYCAIGGKNGTA